MNIVKSVKIEVIIESIQLERFIEMLEEAGAHGYTVFGNISGKGQNGMLDHNCRAKIFSNSYLFTVCSEEVAQNILPQIALFLEDCSGTCFTSEVNHLKV